MANEQTVEVERRFNTLKSDLRNDILEIKEALKILAASMTKLALVEERQTNTAINMTNLTESVSKLSIKVSLLEIEAASSKRIGGWVDRGLITIVSGAMFFILQKIGIF